MERKLAFGSALKEVRTRKEIAQEQLGASQSFVSTVERGIRSPTIEKMEEFAERLGVNPATLIVLMQVGLEGDEDALLNKIRNEIKALKRVGV
ncbi:helix-turn-helix domain-containing protein [Pseudomonas juntendi]|uniref:helix-turn-helix domain-containing protein n=1 Tax=Pseudomonas juntendi TaxID=2666183 RepID=UPI0018DA2030|nr:helix-turn-helix transcriptional regulator [Pseudomonas juntendi]MBH3375654.1 helix-turn-helix transcriptional regulator [Pseudomonas juntendi]